MTLRNRSFDILLDSAEPFDRRGVHSSGDRRRNGYSSDSKSSAFEYLPQQPLRHRLLHSPTHRNGKKRLRVLKFGGTSVGDAHCIERVVEIVRAASREATAVVVVSAMNGVTNKLLDAANAAEAGDRERVSMILKELGKRHDAAATELIHSDGEWNRISDKMREIFKECERMCRGTAQKRKLTLQARDSIVSVGERLSALLVAGALAERGVPSEAVEATELLVTDDNHGSAEPLMDLTKERCSARLRPLMQQGVVPVITGFIGATVGGAITTLGRGSSDYSATILGAALDAQEVIILTDVNGVLTADPRQVAGARTIPEMSYREAAELAHFGAKVMHPKILRPLEQSGIPLWVRNTFAPEWPGTKITPAGPACLDGAKAIAVKSDVAMISVDVCGDADMNAALRRTLAAADGIQDEALLISQPFPGGNICFVLPSATAKLAARSLRHAFAEQLGQESVGRITVDSEVAIVTVVGRNMRDASEMSERTKAVLGSKNVNVIAIVQGSSDCTISILVEQEDVQEALAAIHQELFHPNALNFQTHPANIL